MDGWIYLFVCFFLFVAKLASPGNYEQYNLSELILLVIPLSTVRGVHILELKSREDFLQRECVLNTYIQRMKQHDIL